MHETHAQCVRVESSVSMSRCSQSESLESSLSVSLYEVQMPVVTEEASPLPSYLNSVDGFQFCLSNCKQNTS